MAAAIVSRALCAPALQQQPLHMPPAALTSARPLRPALLSATPSQPRLGASTRASAVAWRAAEAGFDQWEDDDVAGGGGFAERLVQTVRRETQAEEAGAQRGEGEGEEMAVSVECDESGCIMVVGRGGGEQRVEGRGRAGAQQTEGETRQLQCDLTGCHYTSSPSATPSEFRVLEGNGWRLGYETAPSSLHASAAMVGAGGWSVSLSAAEFDDFCKLIQMLRRAFTLMDADAAAPSLNPDVQGSAATGNEGHNEIGMQLERGSVWMECVLQRDRLSALNRFLNRCTAHSNAAFSIRFVLRGSDTQRQAEGSWPAEAVNDMLVKIDQLTHLTPSAAK